jgi:hypothetical protein
VDKNIVEETFGEKARPEEVITPSNEGISK